MGPGMSEKELKEKAGKGGCGSSVPDVLTEEPKASFLTAKQTVKTPPHNIQLRTFCLAQRPACYSFASASVLLGFSNATSRPLSSLPVWTGLTLQVRYSLAFLYVPF